MSAAPAHHCRRDLASARRRWNFNEHYRRLAPTLERAGAAFKRLLPNIGGQNVSCRRLYARVVRSMTLYDAPMWAAAMSKALARRLISSGRVIAIQMIGGEHGLR